MNLKDLHESWVKTGYPSRTEIRKAIEGLLAEQSQKPTEAGLREKFLGSISACLKRYQPNSDEGKVWCLWSEIAAICCQYADDTHEIKPVEADGERGLFEAISELANCRGRRVSTKELRDTLNKFRGGK